jgi:eukaryotic-like serine/threonine-protein kinase
MSLKEGELVGPYRIGRKLGAGAFGGVWFGSHSQTGEPVAIKALLTPIGDGGPGNVESVQRFRREALNLRRIESDYVGHIIGTLEDPTYGLLLVMEFLEGDLLSDMLLESILSVQEAIELGIHIASGLVDMHKAGVIHRDIKPANIMLRPLENGLQRAVIFDLGLSRFIAPTQVDTRDDNSSSDLTTTASRVTLGTLGFMAPEQVLDGHKATEVSDLYAAGVVLYVATCGRMPFEGEDRDLVRSKLSSEAPRLSLGRVDQTNLEFIRIISRCIARKPEARPASALELLSELLALRELAASAPRSIASPIPPAMETPSSGLAVTSGSGARPFPKSYGAFPALMPLPPQAASRSQPILIYSGRPGATEKAKGAQLTILLVVLAALAIVAALVAYAIT